MPVRSQITCLNYRSGDPHTHPPGPVYLIGRYYDPQTGQFLSVDPMVQQTDQAYVYVVDNPVSLTDPTGDLLVGHCGVNLENSSGLEKLR